MTPNVESPSLAPNRAARRRRVAIVRRVVPGSWVVLKRTMDLVVAIGALVLTAPVIGVAALGIACVSPGSPFFTQDRVGKDGRRFRLFKLRTMIDGAHLIHDELHPLSEVDGPVFKIRNDPRLHPLGKMLRRTSIDELPNLLNVILGDMSIVGPRPPLAREVARYNDFARRRLTVKPGITCLWQISGRSNLSFDEWMRLDNAYIDTWSPWGDFIILLKTVPAVLRGEGAH